MVRIINSITLANTTYQNKTVLVTVNLVNTPWQNNDMNGAFANCSNLTSVTYINQNVTNMFRAFANCTNLSNVPEIPNNVTDMSNTFYYCTNITDVTVIPDSVIDMSSTFGDCYNLKNVISISNNVNNMSRTFQSCSRLINIPEIPDSVTNMYGTFQNCSNLTGNIIINSENITNASECFSGTTSEKNVYIPFQNNGVNTATYNAFTTAGYSSTERRMHGVLLKDINYDPLVGYTFTNDANDNYVLTNYTGSDSDITTPHLD